MKSSFLPLFLALTFSVACTTSPQKLDQHAEKTRIASIPFKLHDNRILVNATLNGKGPYTLIFDTGGANIITPECQKELGIRTQSTGTETGAGEGRVDVGFVPIKSMQLGEFQMSDQKFEVIDLSAIKTAFRFPRLDGIVGYELLQRARVAINFDTQTLELFEPSVSNARTDQESLPFDLVGDKPVVEGKIDTQPAKIMIDTGDRSNLTIFTQFGKQTGLAEKFVNAAEIVTGMGVGGPIPGRLATIENVALGPIQISKVVARLPSTKNGYFAKSKLSASVGIGLLKAFNLEFDYQNKMLVLQRRKNVTEASAFVPVPGE